MFEEYDERISNSQKNYKNLELAVIKVPFQNKIYIEKQMNRLDLIAKYEINEYNIINIQKSINNFALFPLKKSLKV